jgi:uncharacterized membrane protein HdeD (DUF308 family)
MLQTPTAPGDLSASIRRSIHDHWGLFLAEGVVLVVLGLAAIALPPVAGLATTVILSWLLLVAGLVGLFSTLRAKEAPGFVWSLLSSVAALAAGVVLLWNPLAGLVTLTFVLTAYFVVDGVLMIVLALSHKSELSGRWEWMLVNGIIDIVLAAIVITGMPGTLVWVLGLLVGIDLLFGGATLIAMALQARQESRTALG